MSFEPYRRFVRSLPEPCLLVTTGGRVIEASRAGLSWLGRKLLGEGVALEELAGPPDLAADLLRRLGRSGDRQIGALEFKDAGGHVVDCRVEGAAVLPRRGEAEGLVWLLFRPRSESNPPFLELNRQVARLSAEVARRMRTEAELDRQREWLEVTLASIGDAVIATDDRSLVTLLNRVAEGLTGWTEVDAIGRPLNEVFRIVQEETLRPAENPVDRVFREGRTVGLANHTLLVARDGRHRPIDDAASPILDRSGRVLGAVLIFRDVTERRAMEDELRRRADSLAEADRRKNEFLAILAHELRNPLAALSNALELARPGPGGEGPADWPHEVMSRQVGHLARMVDDLLDLSRINHGKIVLTPRRLDLADSVANVARLVDPLAEGRGQRFAAEVLDGPIPLDADPTRLEQVLWNLLSNAVKYTPEGGRIALTARREGGEAVVRVRDDGLGIGPDLLPRVFELFSQADRSLAHSQGGLGIGLSLVRGLVELHGGSVGVRSDGPGRGSEFIVRLPLATGQAAVGPAPGPPAEAARRDGPTIPLRVLVVDDNLDSAETLVRLLRRWGHEVASAHDGTAGLEAVRGFQPDLLLLDLGLPGLDGYQVAERIRDGEAGARPGLVVALTGYGRSEDRDQAIRAGFDLHVRKPIEPGRLREVLAEAAARRG